MKSQRLTIRKARQMAARIPPDFLHNTETECLLLRVDKDRKVVETLLFKANPVQGGPSIHGFTHYIILPKYLYP